MQMTLIKQIITDKISANQNNQCYQRSIYFNLKTKINCNI